MRSTQDRLPNNHAYYHESFNPIVFPIISKFTKPKDINNYTIKLITTRQWIEHCISNVNQCRRQEHLDTS
jgi:hypothetical protein